jgi:hypothetical protein
MQLQSEEWLILFSIKINPSIQELEKINSLILQIQDWDYLINIIIDRGIGPLLYVKLPLLTNSSLIPEPVKKKLQQVYYITLSRSSILYEHFGKVADAFIRSSIQVIALKGIYLSESLYKDIGLRQFSDIDLLVKAEDGVECIHILEKLGYKSSEFKVSEFVKKNTEIIHFPPMIRDGVSIEIHTKLNKNREEYKMDMESVWKNAIQTTLNGSNVHTLDLNNQLIHLCLHLDKHFRGGHVQFTCFNDITNFLEKYKDILDWEQLISTCKSYHCENIVFEYLIMVNSFINATLPASIIENYSDLLTDADKKLFIKYLQGDKINSGFRMHRQNIKQVKGVFAKIKYTKDVLFPPKAFMIQLYKIKNPYWAIFYYPYRHLIGLKQIIMTLREFISDRI